MISNFFQKKRVLVTGASGFVGTHLVGRLVELGALVRATVHKNPPQQIWECVEYHNCDLTRPDHCTKVTMEMDYVFMAAANSSGAAVMEKTPLVHLTPNVVMNSHMLAAAYENQVKKFCFISSNTVYPLTNFAVKEDDTNFEFFEKYFIVGWMKLFSEIMCEMYADKIKNPMKTLVVRPGNLYGPYDKFTWKESKVIAALIRRAIERQDPFVVWGDGLDVKDFLYVEDFVEGLLLAFEHTEEFVSLNIASGQPVNIRNVLKAILRATEYPEAPVEYDATKPTMIPKRMIDIERMRILTGWTPKTSIEEGVRKTVKWYRETFREETTEYAG